MFYMYKTLSDVEKRMRNIGCKVVLGTITTISFKNWNSHRKFVGKTVHLKHETEYHIMQEQLNSILYTVRDQPFNLKGGVMVFCFVQNFFFEQHKSYNIYFFPDFNIRLCQKL